MATLPVMGYVVGGALSTGLVAKTSTTSGSTGVSGSTTSSTSSTGTTTAGSTGGSFTLGGSAAFTIASSYYTFGTFRDGGPNKPVAAVLALDAPTSCADLKHELQPDAGRVTRDRRLAEVAVISSTDVAAGTYPIHELFSVLFGGAPDGGVGLAVTLHNFVDGGTGLEYDGNDGSLTVSQPDGVSNLTGSFTSRMIVDGGGVAGDLTGSFDAPYCQTR